MASTQLTDTFKTTIEKTLEFDVNYVVNRPELGELNFQDIAPELLELIKILEEIQNFELSIIPDNIITNLNSYLTNINNQVEAINSFTVKIANPTNQHQAYVNAFRQHYSSFITTISSWYALLTLRSQEFSNQSDEIKKAYKSIQKDIQKTKDDIEAKQKEMDALVSAAKTASSKVGVAQFTEDFYNEYDEFLKSSKKWLITTAAFAGITLTMIIIMVFQKEIIYTPYEAIHIFTSKILLFIFFLGATLWSGKQYSAAKHQAVINKHKSNSLNTFQAFTEASNDVSTKDAVLLEATKAIFSLPESGYLDNKSSSCNDNNATKTIEIVRSTSKIAGDAT